eukprot:TRINITY_DN10873_c0_g1_i1.p1 TRINITY_DN10873_c0_g1~~TRINITY_DN10873_c0_g1_i1.p1  ORF type:complete len:344 (+),score=21.86 TRINITY_DN10873_c0_g1_i1:241-1272(+)
MPFSKARGQKRSDLTFPATGTVYGLGTHIKLAPREPLFDKERHEPRSKTFTGRRSAMKRRQEFEAYKSLPFIPIDDSQEFIKHSPRRTHDINYDPTRSSLNGYSSRHAAEVARIKKNESKQNPTHFIDKFKTTGTVTTRYGRRRPPVNHQHQPLPPMEVKSVYQEYRLCPTPDWCKLDSGYFDDVLENKIDESTRSKGPKRSGTPFSFVPPDSDASSQSSVDFQHSASSSRKASLDSGGDTPSDYEQIYVRSESGQSTQFTSDSRTASVQGSRATSASATAQGREGDSVPAVPRAPSAADTGDQGQATADTGGASGAGTDTIPLPELHVDTLTLQTPSSGQGT